MEAVTLEEKKKYIVENINSMDLADCKAIAKIITRDGFSEFVRFSAEGALLALDQLQDADSMINQVYAFVKHRRENRTTPH